MPTLSITPNGLMGCDLPADLRLEHQVRKIDTTKNRTHLKVPPRLPAELEQTEISRDGIGALSMLKRRQRIAVDRMGELVTQLGVFLGMKAVIASMSAAGGGSIINISSLGGMTGFPGVFAYQATKWASRGVTKWLSGF